jgi:two-component system KDP operon response regulator KdpE
MTATQPTVIVIEDDQKIRRFLKATLCDSGFRYIEAETGKKGLSQVNTQMPDLVILDLGLPDMDGLAIIREIRGWSQTPILILSVRSQEKDKVAALDAGADDYLTKPFGVEELLARIRAALRRGSRSESAETVFHQGDLEVDLVRRLVHVGSQEIHLTPIEYRLLATLVKYAGRVVTHEQLLREVWGPHAESESQYLRVYINQLRHKLEVDPARPQYLLTEIGVGYRLKTT